MAKAKTSRIPRGQLRIRMYRGILGDCFLMRVGTVAGTKSILIDCGVLKNVEPAEILEKKLDPAVIAPLKDKGFDNIKGGDELIRTVAKDVIASTNGHIDLLVVTHEHYDHLSGFALAREAFEAENVTIGRLWLAWTEDPDDPQANQLRARFNKSRDAIGLALELSQTSAGEQFLSVAALSEFIGPIPNPGPQPKRPKEDASKELDASRRLTTRQTIDMLKRKTGLARTRYLEPGQIVDLDDFGIRAHVLGPPRDEALLRKDAPSHGAGKEVYLTDLNLAAAVESTLQTRLALDGESDLSGDGKRSMFSKEIPFARPHQRNFDFKKGVNYHRGKSFEVSYVDSDNSVYNQIKEKYLNPDDKHRRVDEDWTATVEALALKMDSDTNNTSLALAFELTDGQVLLFPGDAQVGNWLSWSNQTYPAKPDPKDAPPLTIGDLLSRVTFYKVGHHASHNATLKAFGLDRMTDPRLTAAIPVVEAVAAIQGKGRRQPGKGWKMPYEELYKNLVKMTSNRIVKGDGDPEAERQAFAAANSEKKKAVTLAYGKNDLWVELIFPTMKARP